MMMGICHPPRHLSKGIHPASPQAPPSDRKTSRDKEPPHPRPTGAVVLQMALRAPHAQRERPARHVLEAGQLDDGQLAAMVSRLFPDDLVREGSREAQLWEAAGTPRPGGAGQSIGSAPGEAESSAMS